ncbi:MAG: AAC(3) family N-acetyltransferase [Ruminococcaceae bacterium]|nr:AAC(3) family N-acetyltransferase [Oscillospiraceae bacterium]
MQKRKVKRIMLTKSDIADVLNKMNVPRDKPVMVHTSLRSIGPMEGGGQMLLDALIEHCTAEGGLLCIPTHSWGYMEAGEEIVLDLVTPKSNLGVLPNLALQDGRGVRSAHITHSVTVFGEQAAEFARLDDAATTMVSICCKELYRLDGYVLLIGVGQEKNTFLHCVEEMLGVPNRTAEQPISLKMCRPDGVVAEKQIYPLYAEGIADVSVHFGNYEPAFRKHGCIADGKLGDAKVQLCSAKKMKEVMELIFNRSHHKELLADDTPIDEVYY